VVVRGKGCTAPGNSCAATVGTIANQIASAAIGLPSNKVNVTLITASGARQSCNPLNTCFSDATVWPPAGNNDNGQGRDVTVSATYTFQSALAMFWPGAGSVQFGTIVLPASSTQRILF
jgi:hypothetical protein